MMPTYSGFQSLAQASKCMWKAGCLLAILAWTGCVNPANWPPEKVAADVQQQWAKYEVTEVNLTRTPAGFEGTAKCSTGETLKVQLNANANTKTVQGSGVGDRGTELEYSLQIK